MEVTITRFLSFLLRVGGIYMLALDVCLQMIYSQSSVKMIFVDTEVSKG